MNKKEYQIITNEIAKNVTYGGDLYIGGEYYAPMVYNLALQYSELDPNFDKELFYYNCGFEEGIYILINGYARFQGIEPYMKDKRYQDQWNDYINYVTDFKMSVFNKVLEREE
jgi:hypothetical protein